MKTRLALFASFIISALLISFIADDEPLKKILIQLEKYRSEYPQEKVHLHLDKQYYAIGDNIWFKAYIVNADKNELSNLSKFLYVELINDKDSVKQMLRLPVTVGLTWGDFSLADSLQEGNYRIRAYTAYMRNFDEQYFFDKTITVGNSISNHVITEVNYAFAKEGAGQKVTANINYSDIDGNPLINKEVTYTIQLDFRNISKGKAVTDAKGNVQISFVNTQPFILKSGKISTLVKLDDNHSVSKNFPVKATSNDVDVQFFPESGDLINGIRSKIAFKAVGANGLGTTISGFIADSANNKLAEFKSEHAGMGVFALQPLEGRSYKAHITFEDGSEKVLDLPRILNRGYVLSANNNQDHENILVKISTSANIPLEGEITLIAQTNGAVQYVSKSKLDKHIFTAAIPKKRFPTGLLHLTLFSPQNEPVAERLVFINHANDQLQVNVSTDKNSYATREKVRMTLDVKDEEGKPSIGSFSMAVTDETKTPSNELNETTILSNLLLSSDLKGYIEQPNYYFSNRNETTDKHLDLLMLTQGWTRFTWKNILSDTYPGILYQPEVSMKISGRVTSFNGKPVANGKVTLFSSSGDVFLLDTLTNAEGLFSFDNLYFSDSTKFVVQARNAKDRKNVEITLDRIPPALVTRNKNAAAVEVNVNNSMLAYLKNSRSQFEEFKRFGLINKSIMLSEVKVVEKKKIVKQSANLNGAGRADAVITSDQLQNCTDLAQCLQGRVAGIIVRNGRVYSARSMYSSLSGPVPMQLVLDGMPLDADFLSSINPNDVETIEVLKSAANTAIYGLRGGGGILVITTKRGTANSGYRSYAPGITSYYPKGLSKSREFYMPNYDDPKINTHIPDLRTTIYWNPQVITDSTGRASVEFFNADVKGNYRAIVEGINANGKIGRQILRYTVK